jgi:molybdopterin converting factor small subunit
MYIEFLGIPRQRAGVAQLQIEATTLRQALATLRSQLPAFAELITSEGLHPSLAANLNGDRFLNDLDTRLAEDDRLLILSADVGG